MIRIMADVARALETVACSAIARAAPCVVYRQQRPETGLTDS
jgi:hypothetical protein